MRGAETEQCVVVVKAQSPATVKHSRSCVSDYCEADYQCEQVNRHIRRVRESGK